MGNGDEDAPGDKASSQAQSGTYDQAFFLALAAKGKDNWNAWRRDPANKDVRVTFDEIDFGQVPWDEINFEGFEFGDLVDFSNCKWRGAKWSDNPEAFVPGRAYFTGAVFGDGVRFMGAAFGSLADFAGATFGRSAAFYGAAFGSLADFAGATFGEGATFMGATFGRSATFYSATFGRSATFYSAAFAGEANFSSAVFGNYAVFTGTAFGPRANLSQTRFKGEARFTARTSNQWTEDLANVPVFPSKAPALEKRHKESWKRNGFGPDRFLDISFADAHFDGEAVFSGRSFEQTADFTNARFYYPPNFDGVPNPGKIDFTGAHIGFAPRGKLLHWTEDSLIPVRLRAFRKVAEETKNHDLERDLYIEERKAERGVYWRQQREELKAAPFMEKPLVFRRLAGHAFWIIVLGVYWVLADYGRGPVRPFMWWLVLSLIIFPSWYRQLLPLPQLTGPLDADKYEQAVQMVARANAVPFVGPLAIDAEIKKILFCPGFGECRPIPPKSYQWLATFQNIVSIILAFFIGLALRNYFKIK